MAFDTPERLRTDLEPPTEYWGLKASRATKMRCRIISTLFNLTQNQVIERALISYAKELKILEAVEREFERGPLSHNRTGRAFKTEGSTMPEVWSAVQRIREGALSPNGGEEETS